MNLGIFVLCFETPSPPSPFHLQSQVDVVGADRQQLADLASLLCATLQSLLRKISSDDAKQISDMVMRAIYLMLNSKSAQAGGVQEDAIMTVGVLVEGKSRDCKQWGSKLTCCSYLFYVIGVSQSEPHTYHSCEKISVPMYVCDCV